MLISKRNIFNFHLVTREESLDVFFFKFLQLPPLKYFYQPKQTDLLPKFLAAPYNFPATPQLLEQIATNLIAAAKIAPAIIAYRRLSDLADDRGDRLASIAYLHKIQHLDPNNPKILLEIADRNLHLDRYHIAQAQYLQSAQLLLKQGLRLEALRIMKALPPPPQEEVAPYVPEELRLEAEASALTSLAESVKQSIFWGRPSMPWRDLLTGIATFDSCTSACQVAEKIWLSQECSAEFLTYFIGLVFACQPDELGWAKLREMLRQSQEKQLRTNFTSLWSCLAENDRLDREFLEELYEKFLLAGNLEYLSPCLLLLYEKNFQATRYDAAFQNLIELLLLQPAEFSRYCKLLDLLWVVAQPEKFLPNLMDLSKFLDQAPTRDMEREFLQALLTIDFQAVEVHQRLKRIAHDHGHSDEYLLELKILAEIYRLGGKVDGEIEILEELSRADKNNEMAISRLIELNQVSGQISKLPDCYIAYSEIWWRKAKWQRAMSQLEKALSLDPENMAAKRRMLHYLIHLEDTKMVPDVTQIMNLTDEVTREYIREAQYGLAEKILKSVANYLEFKGGGEIYLKELAEKLKMVSEIQGHTRGTLKTIRYLCYHFRHLYDPAAYDALLREGIKLDPGNDKLLDIRTEFLISQNKTRAEVIADLRENMGQESAVQEKIMRRILLLAPDDSSADFLKKYYFTDDHFDRAMVLYLQELEQLQLAGDDGRALKLIAKIMKLDPLIEDAYVELINILKQNKRINDAINILMVLVDILIKRRAYDLALQYTREIGELDPRNTEAIKREVNIHHCTHNEAALLESLDRLAAKLEEQQRWLGYIETLEKLAVLRPTDHSVQEKLYQTKLRIDDAPGALSHLLILYRCHEAGAASEESAAVIEKMLEIDPQNMIAQELRVARLETTSDISQLDTELYHLAEIYLNNGELLKAEQTLKRILEFTSRPELPLQSLKSVYLLKGEPQNGIEVLLKLSQLAMARLDYDSASTHLNEILEDLSPRAPSACFMKSEIRLARNDIRGALFDLGELRAYAHAQHDGKTELECLRRIIRVEPTSLEHHLALKDTLIHYNFFDDASAEIIEILNLFGVELRSELKKKMLMEGYRYTPKNIEILKRLANVAKDEGDSQNEQNYKMRLCQVLVDQAQFREVGKYLLEFLQKGIINDTLMSHFKALYLYKKDVQGGIAFFEKLVDRFEQKKNWPYMIAALNALVDLAPDNQTYRIKLKNFYRSRGEGAKLLLLLKEWRDYYEKQADLVQWENTLREIADLDPNNLEYRRELKDFYRNQGMTEKALEQLEILVHLMEIEQNLESVRQYIFEGLALKPSAETFRLRLIQHYLSQRDQEKALIFLLNWSREAMDEGNFQKALAYSHQSLQLDAYNLETYFLRKEMYFRQNKIAQARDELTNLLKRVFAEKQYQPAELIIQEILEFDPQNRFVRSLKTLVPNA